MLALSLSAKTIGYIAQLFAQRTHRGLHVGWVSDLELHRCR